MTRRGGRPKSPTHVATRQKRLRRGGPPHSDHLPQLVDPLNRVRRRRTKSLRDGFQKGGKCLRLRLRCAAGQIDFGHRCAGGNHYLCHESGNPDSRSRCALSHSTQYRHDALGRQDPRVTRPLGMFQASVYDAVNNLVSRTDFDGQVTQFGDDALDRRIETTLPDGTTETIAYTPAGRRATVSDARGSTSYTYDVRHRLLSRTEPGGAMLRYTYDAAGNRASDTTPAGTTTYEDHALNRLVRLTDPQGGETTYGYDPVGNRLATVLPNGSTASYAYDSLNRLVALQNRAQDLSAISSYDYTLSPTGNRVRVVEGSGRRVDYTYDALLRLTGEQIVDPAGGSATTYTYDAVGNRRSKSSDLTGLLVYVYDANDRLLSEGATTYSYDANGNLLTKSMGGATAIPSTTADAD